jgi:MFS family permease
MSSVSTEVEKQHHDSHIPSTHSLSPSESDKEKEHVPAPHDEQPTSETPAAAPAAKPSGPPGAPPGMAPPPNGGLVAWLQVLGSWMLFFNTWGILNTFGVYQTYYESGALFHTTSSNISWVGSIQAFLVLMVGSVSGPIYDRGHFRYLLIAGTFFVVFGHMMLSLCHEFWQVILAQGFTVGIGAGLLFVPAIAIMPAYFSSRIGLAIGLAASGSSMGGIIYPITFFRLIDRIGFGWSTRVLGFMALATLMVPLTVMKMRFKPAKARDLVDWSAFRDVPYLTFVFGAMIGYIGLYVSFFYISFYGQQQRITDESLSFYLVPILNAGSVFGRTLPNWLSDYTGPLNTVVPGKSNSLPTHFRHTNPAQAH